MSFDKVAQSIIENSIQSAIYIDDKLIAPFENTKDTAAKQVSSSLYKSFRSHNIGLDFYKYKPNVDWRINKKLLFTGRDLIILDWQLDNNLQEKNTLEILEQAVLTPSLHFVCIYTSTEIADFPAILYSIKAYFSEFDTNFVSAAYATIKETYDEQLTDDFLGSVKGLFKEYGIYDHRKDELFAEIEQKFRTQFTTDYNAFATSLRAISQNPRKAYEAIGYAINNEVLRTTPGQALEMRIFVDKNFLFLNHTVIQVSNKTSQTPRGLYGNFSKAVVKSAGNFLTLMSLEIKNLFRDGSGFMGKEIDSIEEAVFFYHKDQLNPPDSFYDFLIELWKGQSMSFLYERNKSLQILGEDILVEYRKKKGLNKKVKSILKSTTSDKELAKLNYYYNSMNVQRNLDDFLRFGDIFCILSENSQNTNDFLLCITAHCDCLYPEKLKNLFYFVKGSKCNIEEALKEGDSGYTSYFKNEKSEIVSIRWKDKPFTIHLSNNLILNANHSVSIESSNKNIKYISTLKENYTQRVANKAFTYPLHVGIYYADKKLTEE